MSTLRRDLRNKFEEIMKNNMQFMFIFSISDTADEMADAALEIVRKPAFDVTKAGVDWAILAGGLTQEQIDGNKVADEARGAFERDLHFNPLPWSSTKDWEKLEKFVVQEFQKDKQVFFKYDSWRKGKGKFAGALNNKNITQTPSSFIACFPDFLAHTEMYPEKPEAQQPKLIEDDQNDAPITY